MSNEQRLYPRYELNLHVQYSDTNRQMTASSNDISQGGVFLSTSKPAQPGTRVALEIELPDFLGTVWATGSVVHSLPGRGMGIAFNGFGPGSKEKLAGYLSSVK